VIRAPIYNSQYKQGTNTLPTNRCPTIPPTKRHTIPFHRIHQNKGWEEASRQQILTGVPHGGADGVAASEEQLGDPGRDVTRRAGDAHHLPHPGRRRRAHLLRHGLQPRMVSGRSRKIPFLHC
jgi:hypothetical protein